jgi:signal transduction histidine kinase
VSDRPTIRPPQPLWVDAVLAFAVVAAQIAGTEILVRTAGSDRPMDVVGYGLLAASGGALAFRDRAPVGVLLAVVGSVLVYTWLGYAGGFYTVSLVFAIWAAVAAGYRVVALVVCGALIALVIVASYVVPIGHAADADAPIWMAGWLAASFVLGEVSRSRRRYLEQVEQRAIDAERTREEEARRRAGEERLRIARDLHDVLAHNISTINVQAGVAAHLIGEQSDQARDALITIKDTSKDALRELRDTLGMLRQVDDERAPRTPSPSLARLDELVAAMSAGGMEVRVERTGAPRPLPPTVDRAAYRIVQESLTNVTRYAHASTATVSLDYGPYDLTVQVDDDGRGSSAAVPTGGSGIAGMRERVAAAGGDLEVGPLPGRGFRVRARLPLDPDR